MKIAEGRQGGGRGGRGGEGEGGGVELVTVATQLKVLVRARFTIQRIQISKVILEKSLLIKLCDI